MDTIFQNFQPLGVREKKDNCLSVDGLFTKIGIWTEGEFCWIDPSASAQNTIFEEYYLTLDCQTFDAFIHDCKVLYVRINIRNQKHHSQGIKIYFQQEIQCQKGEDVVYYAPNKRVMMHHSSDSLVLCNGKYKETGIRQYSMQSRAKTPHLFKDLYTGSLCFQPFSSKNVRSAFTLEGNLESSETQTAYYWLIKGQNPQNIDLLNRFLQKNTLEFRGEK
jgi:hypothetical protein